MIDRKVGDKNIQFEMTIGKSADVKQSRLAKVLSIKIYCKFS